MNPNITVSRTGRSIARATTACLMAAIAIAASAQVAPTASPPAAARMLNPQPLPPRWGAQPTAPSAVQSSAQSTAIARPVPGVETGIIIVGGRPVAASPTTAMKKLDPSPGRRN